MNKDTAVGGPQRLVPTATRPTPRYYSAPPPLLPHTGEAAWFVRVAETNPRAEKGRESEVW